MTDCDLKVEEASTVDHIPHRYFDQVKPSFKIGIEFITAYIDRLYLNNTGYFSCETIAKIIGQFLASIGHPQFAVFFVQKGLNVGPIADPKEGGLMKNCTVITGITLSES